MKRLIAHIGPRKTGSTSIQRLLESCAESLRAAGIQVPGTGTIPFNRGTHIALAREAARGGHELWANLTKEIRNCRQSCFVLSAEDFASPFCRAHAAARLAELSARERLDICIVAYVRPQWQIIEAEYSQQVCGRGQKDPFPRFAARQLRAGDNTILDYNTVFAPYRMLFGERVKVFPLERSSLPEGLLAHFLAQIGAPAEILQEAPTERANLRRGATEVEVRRLLQARLGSTLARRVKPLLSGLSEAIGNDDPFAGFGMEEVRAIQMRFAAANRQFALDYGIDAAGRLFRDIDCGTGPRPNVARWQQLDEEERRRLTGYVRQEVGYDLDASAWSQARFFLRVGTPALAMHARNRAKRMLRRP